MTSVNYDERSSLIGARVEQGSAAPGRLQRV
jgi:hypothetical protein